MLTQTIAQDKYNIYRSETIVVGSFFMSSQFQKLVSTFFKYKKNLVTIFLPLFQPKNERKKYLLSDYILSIAEWIILSIANRRNFFTGCLHFNFFHCVTHVLVLTRRTKKDSAQSITAAKINNATLDPHSSKRAL